MKYSFRNDYSSICHKKVLEKLIECQNEQNIGYGEDYEVLNLEPGVYDIAVDFKGEYNSFNSKKDKSLVLKIERGMRKIWIVDTDGKIVID